MKFYADPKVSWDSSSFNQIEITPRVSFFFSKSDHYGDSYCLGLGWLIFLVDIWLEFEPREKVVEVDDYLEYEFEEITEGEKEYLGLNEEDEEDKEKDPALEGMYFVETFYEGDKVAQLVRGLDYFTSFFPDLVERLDYSKDEKLSLFVGDDAYLVTPMSRADPKSFIVKPD